MKSSNDGEIEAYISSGNIFADVGHPNPEEAKAKSDLAIELYRLMRESNFTYAYVAEILGIDHSDIYDIVKGKLSEYSVDTLRSFVKIIYEAYSVMLSRMEMEEYITENVLADVGATNPKEAQIKSDVTIEIFRSILESNLEYEYVAKILEIRVYDLYSIVNGQVSEYSTETLASFREIINNARKIRRDKG